MKPIHKHDCDKCHFLGNFVSDKTTYDLYYCDGFIATLIARYGENGAYSSGMIFGFLDKDDTTSPLGEAWRRAKQKGFKVQES